MGDKAGGRSDNQETVTTGFRLRLQDSQHEVRRDDEPLFFKAFGVAFVFRPNVVEQSVV